MNKYEKETIRLIETHEKARKSVLIKNINHAIKSKGIYRHGKNQWVSKVTGSPLSTVNTWFSNARCKALNKIPLYAVCKIAVALHISVWELYETENTEEETGEPKIDRKSSLYWHLRRNEAKHLWNSSYGQNGTWEMQSKAVKREFVDKLYLEKLEEQKNGEQPQGNP